MLHRAHSRRWVAWTCWKPDENVRDTRHIEVCVLTDIACTKAEAANPSRYHNIRHSCDIQSPIHRIFE